MNVWARNYSMFEDKWIAAKVVGKRGNVLYDILTIDNRKWVRHLDQLRVRRTNEDMSFDENEDDPSVSNDLFSNNRIPCSNAPLNPIRESTNIVPDPEVDDQINNDVIIEDNQELVVQPRIDSPTDAISNNSTVEIPPNNDRSSIASRVKARRRVKE